MFNTELDFFIDNQKELVEKHRNKVLAIKGKNILAVYDSPLDAYLDIQHKEQLGSVMLQPCLEGESAYTTSIITKEIFE